MSKPCPKGHDAPRNKFGHCPACNRERAAASDARRRAAKRSTTDLGALAKSPFPVRSPEVPACRHAKGKIAIATQVGVRTFSDCSKVWPRADALIVIRPSGERVVFSHWEAATDTCDACGRVVEIKPPGAGQRIVSLGVELRYASAVRRGSLKVYAAMGLSSCIEARAARIELGVLTLLIAIAG